MAQYPNIAAGQRITGQLLRDMQPTYIYKTVNTDRASTTTLTNDPDLTVDLDANAVYMVEFCVMLGGPGPTKTAWAVPAGSDGLKGVQGPASTANSDDGISMRTGSHNFGTVVTYGYRSSGAGNLEFIQESGLVITTTAGTLAYQWAQVTSNTTPARCGRGSWMRVTRVQ
ncbi:hypothetical protein [Streptomyces meridianus]|uniref:Uncharacterized protein n=1 Tax=Streptomyces meridianus TaxID=2938945 RepID=A0ABT0XDE1_9ACTN|nr:hypothetical protein [Streptomyces meridianus]MCM2580439.1 hypothetical protein [Streptomyces meridianus]